MSPFTQSQNRYEHRFLMRTLHKELLAQQWSQAELTAFYNSSLPDLIVQIAASTLRKVDALPLADIKRPFIFRSLG
ncbi:hypothetical protein GC175_06755 [bacterium]|nr:hypothetical protein [bacterium]